MDQRLEAYLELEELPDAEVVSRAYRLVLRRAPDDEGLERALALLRDGRLSRSGLVGELASSDEFASLRRLDDAVALGRRLRELGEVPRELTGAADTDERVVELPWCLARYRGEPRVLDVGYAFAEPAHLAALLRLGAPELTGVDVAERDVPGLRSVVADVRDLPFPRRSFDLAFCVSTLEHVGRDTSVYGVDVARDAETGMAKALGSLRRVLARRGRLLLSVPCGEPEDHGWFVQLEPAAWLDLFVRSGFAVHEHEVYELGSEGWSSAPRFDPRGVRYGARGPAASAVVCAELRPPRLLARR